MKLVQRKCPSCGASLEFDENAKEVTCEYCKQKLTIEREENKDNFDTTDFSLRVAKYYEEKKSNYGKKIALRVAAVFGVFLVLSGIFTLSEEFGKEEKKLAENRRKEDEWKQQNIREYGISISDIDAKSLELFHKETKKELSDESDFLPGDSKETEWEYVGMYLLVSKDLSKYNDKMNMLFDVYKKTYTIKNQKYNAYSARRYDNLKLSNDGIIIHSFSGRGMYIMNFLGSMSYFVNGYNTLDEFYTKEIREFIGDYDIAATDGLPLEKK